MPIREARVHSGGRVRGFRALRRLLVLELRRVSRSLADWGLSWVFFVLVISVFAIGMGGHFEKMSVQQGVGIIWVGAMLATLLSFERLLRADFESGILEQALLSPWPLAGLMAMKMGVHWLVTGLPLLLLTPLMLLFLGLPSTILPVLLWSIAIGTQILSALGSLGVVLTLGLKRAGLLLTILLLPLFVPTLIFATTAVVQVGLGAALLDALSLLLAVWIVTQLVMPWAVASTLRASLSQS